MTPPPQAEAGGLANAIFGSLRDGGAGHAWARPSASWPASTWPNTAQDLAGAACTRFINDILLSAPSIVLGLFIYAVVVAPSRAFRAGPACWRWR
jgi:phosphate transport system permease protein